MNNLENTIEQAQKITLGQIDNGTLATVVNCADTVAIVRHGRVESYVMPKHLIDEILLKVAVVECDNKRLLGERVAGSIPVPKSHFFNRDFKIDMDAVTSCDMPHVSESMREMEISRRLRTLEKEPKIDLGFWRENWLNQYVCLRPEQTTKNPRD